MSKKDDCVMKVSLESSPDYLPRVRRIVGCLADSLGMDQQETDETKLALTEACVNAIRHGSPQGAKDRVEITLAASDDTITLNIIDSGGASKLDAHEVSGFGMRLMRSLADRVQLLGHKTGLTVRLTKRARTSAKTRRRVSF